MALRSPCMPSPTSTMASALSPYTDSPSSPAPFTARFPSSSSSSNAPQRNSAEHSDTASLAPPPSPYPQFVDPSPVESHGSASTQTTEIDDSAEDHDVQALDAIDAGFDEQDDRIESASPLSPQAALARVDTALAARTRADSSDTGPQSVIHAPQNFRRSFDPSSVDRKMAAHVSPSPTDRSDATVVSPTSPDALAAPDKQKEPVASPLLNTDIPAIKDRSTPRAQTRQEVEEEWKRRSKRSKSLEDIPEGQDGDRVDEDDDETLATSTDQTPQFARVSAEQVAQVESLKAALSECWTLTNTLANLSATHRTRVFNYRGQSGVQETAWQKCWKLCKELYNTRDADPTDHVLTTLSMCREFCTALFDARRKDDEMADSVLRVSFELNQHLFNTQDPQIPAAFQERTLDFYLTLCHRLMKQRTSLPEETDALLRACWPLAEMLFSIRQNNRDGKPADEELVGSAVQACWELCDLFREGWSQVRPDRGTPRATTQTQASFTQSQGSFGRSQSAFSNRSSPSLTRSTSTSHSYNDATSFPPETPTTIFDDATDDDNLSPELQAPNILVLGPPEHNSNASHHRQPHNSKGWSSAASTHSGYSDSTTRSTSAKATVAMQANMACIRILLVKSAVIAGYKGGGTRSYSPSSGPSSSASSVHSSSSSTGQLTSATTNKNFTAFVKDLPASGSFGSQAWQMALAQHVKELVLKWPGLVQHVGAGGDLGDGRMLPGHHESSGAKAKRSASAGDVARAVQWMMRHEQYAWMSGLYRVVFGCEVDEGLRGVGGVGGVIIQG